MVVAVRPARRRGAVGAPRPRGRRSRTCRSPSPTRRCWSTRRSSTRCRSTARSAATSRCAADADAGDGRGRRAGRAAGRRRPRRRDAEEGHRRPRPHGQRRRLAPERIADRTATGAPASGPAVESAHRARSDRPHDKTRAMVLSAEEARVVACLVEKEATVPDSYPLTLERAAAGVQPDVEPQPDRGVGRPHRRGRAAVAEVDGPGALRAPVARRPHDPLPPRRRRALAPVEGRAGVLAVLVLRGPQTTGEVRTRTERMIGADDGTVEEILDMLTARSPEPFAARVAAAAGRAGGPLGPGAVGRAGGRDRARRRPRARSPRRHRPACRRRRRGRRPPAARTPTSPATSPSCGHASSAWSACSASARTSPPTCR